jgi:hypothetical protein
MRVLVLETDPGTARAYEDELRDAGHEVVRCHDRGATSFPCHGVTEEGCPLDHGVVDAAVVVRDPIATRVTARESGVSCAIRARIPVLEPAVEAGAPSPFAGWVEPFDGDVVAAVEEAVRRPSEGHADAVRAHLLRSPAAAGLQRDDLSVVAIRDGKRLRVEVGIPTSRPALREVAAAWAASAAREYDPGLQVIDVSLRSA